MLETSFSVIGRGRTKDEAVDNLKRQMEMAGRYMDTGPGRDELEFIELDYDEEEGKECEHVWEDFDVMAGTVQCVKCKVVKDKMKVPSIELKRRV